MGRLKAISIALAFAVAAAATLSACGSEKADLLPGETASEINANLDLVETLVDEGDCVGAANAATAVGEQVEALTGVNEELKEALTKGANRLNEVIVECDEAVEEEDTTETVEPDEEEREADEEKQQQKDEKAAQKEAEKEQKDEEKSEKETPPVEPPGQEKQEEKELPPTEPEDGGTPSGGVSPGVAAGAE
jgi:outer membrane biosynthesis protein TonB